MVWQPEVRRVLDDLIHSTKPNKIAVFDADGTLWHDDLGEAFFKYQIEKKLAPGLKGIDDPWQTYRLMTQKNAAAAYGWLAQINAGVYDKDLHEQAAHFYAANFRQRLNPDLKQLFLDLKRAQFDVWICTASIKWALAPAAIDLGLNLDRLIAVDVKLDGKGRLTDQLIQPIPFRPGKRYWLEKRLTGAPLLVAGNSMGDLEMMTLAEELPLGIIFKPHLPDIKESEEGFILEATKRGWPIQIFQ